MDGDDLYSCKLGWFKENEKPEEVLLVADDPELVKVIVAWSNTVTKCAEPTSALVEDSEDYV